MKKISVIIPFYNGNKHLVKMKKVLDCNYESLRGIAELEVLFVNDSPWIEVEMQYLDDAEYTIKIIKHSQNAGIHQARVVCGMRISKRKALKCYYKNLIFCMIAILILLFLGLTQNKVYNFSYGTGYSLGTGHSNNLALLILNLTLLWVYLNSEKNKYTIAAICIVVSALTWKITVSRTSTILLATFGIVYFLFYYMLKTNNKFLLHLLRILILGIICGAIYFMIGGNTESILHIDDNNFAVRFLQAQNIYDRYGLSLWGNNIKFVSMAEAAITKEAVVILDNGLLRLLLFHGCACFGVFILGLVSLEASASRRKDYLLIVISVIFLITGLMEKSVYTLQMNFTLLLMTGLGTGISQDEADKLHD